MVEIREKYKDFKPPRAALKAIKRLIHHTPKKYLADLHSIRLSNANALNRKLRRQKTKSRGKTVSLHNCSGWYVQKWNNEFLEKALVLFSFGGILGAAIISETHGYNHTFTDINGKTSIVNSKDDHKYR